MKRILFTAGLIIFVAFAGRCQEHDTSGSHGYLMTNQPFEIVHKNYKCLKIDHLKGMALLSLFVQEDGSIVHFNVSQLRLIDENEDTIVKYNKIVYKFLPYESYPEKVKQYYPDLKKFVSKIELKKTPGAKVGKQTIFYVFFRIGCHK